MVSAPAAERTSRENRTRYVVLGMLTFAPMTGYGLRQAIDRSVGHFWQESYGQLYPTLRRLAAEGLVEATGEGGGSGRRSETWAITERGRKVLAGWLSRPPVLEPARNELLLKFFFADAVPREVTARNLDAAAAALRAYGAELEGIAAHVDAVTGPGRPVPPGRLTIDYGLGFVRMTLDWLEHAREYLAGAAARGAGGARRNTGARRRTAARTPGEKR